jgi:hypothetical protein
VSVSNTFNLAVANTNDAPTGVPTITGTATEDQVLTLNTSAISDADGLGEFSYQWQGWSDTDGDGLVDTCYESNDVFDRIGQPIGSNVDPLGFDDPVNFVDDPTGLGGPVDFNDPTGLDDGSEHSEEGPIGSDAGKEGEEPLASDAGKGEE